MRLVDKLMFSAPCSHTLTKAFPSRGSLSVCLRRYTNLVGEGVPLPKSDADHHYNKELIMGNSIFEKAWETAFHRFFCPDTELFYDFVIDEDNNAWHHLPAVEEIKASVPNPCGWGTGMEDSSINGGSALDALVSAYAISKDSRIKKYTDAIFRGLLRCAAKEDNGFIARSVSPFDKKSRYIESSRDQYTHWIYGALRLYDSPLCDGEQRAEISRVLTSVADKCIKDVVPENGYQMTRADGSIGLVGKMWGGVGAHEILRLPMFYLAAFHVSGDEKYKKKYSEYINEALEGSLAHKPEAMRCYCSLQMQCSLRTVYDYDLDPAVREKTLALMRKNAEYGTKKAVFNSKEFCKPEHRDDINYKFRKWNEVEPRDMGHFGGFDYINPAQSERKDNRAFYPVREVAEGAIMAAMCPKYRISDELLTAVDNMAAAVDFKRHSSVYAPLLLASAHISCKENLMINK